MSVGAWDTRQDLKKQNERKQIPRLRRQTGDGESLRVKGGQRHDARQPQATVSRGAAAGEHTAEETADA